MHTNVMHDNAIAFIIHHYSGSAAVALSQEATEQLDWLSRTFKLVAWVHLSLTPTIDAAADASRGRQYTLRRTATRGATTPPATGRTTGRATTAAPPAATQPARTTPRAQTTALASMVLKVMKLPASNRGIIRCFMTTLLGL